MAQNPQMEVQGEVMKSLFDAMHAEPIANIFNDTSYALLGILDKQKWIRTGVVEKKKTNRDQAQIMEEWDNIHDPILKTNPNSLREEACKRMEVATRKFQLAYKKWFYRLPQYMVPFVHYFPELVHEGIQHFNPDTGAIEGQELRVNISMEAIRNMLCIPTRGSRVEKMELFTPKKGYKYCRGRDITMDFYNQETQRP